ncbi:MAG: hypothetical protein GY822_08300 [Deltaproteobacteria bacterium]|nr:hypothetical protein [Deltaproteobacteria bacterium]
MSESELTFAASEGRTEALWRRALSFFFNWAMQESLSALVVQGSLVQSSTRPWLRDALLEHLQLGVGAAGPEQADVLVVVGEVSQKFAPVLQETWAKMAAPCWVLEIGVLSHVERSYARVHRLEEVIPVDVRIEGIPPTDDALRAGLQALRTRIRGGGT